MFARKWGFLNSNECGKNLEIFTIRGQTEVTPIPTPTRCGPRHLQRLRKIRSDKRNGGCSDCPRIVPILRPELDHRSAKCRNHQPTFDHRITSKFYYGKMATPRTACSGDGYTPPGQFANHEFAVAG